VLTQLAQALPQLREQMGQTTASTADVVEGKQ
jgi:hypothetical protein